MLIIGGHILGILRYWFPVNVNSQKTKNPLYSKVSITVLEVEEGSKCKDSSIRPLYLTFWPHIFTRAWSIVVIFKLYALT